MALIALHPTLRSAPVTSLSSPYAVPVHLLLGLGSGFGRAQITPRATIASATFVYPARFAPTT
jgi:hypothetical protein